MKIILRHKDNNDYEDKLNNKLFQNDPTKIRIDFFILLPRFR